MDRVVVVLLLSVFTVLACGPGRAAPESPPPVAVAQPPVEPTQMMAVPLPDSIYLQLTNHSTGWVYRVAEDGRFFVTPSGGEQTQQRPMSKLDPGEVVSEQGVIRLRTAVELAGFFTLQDRVEGTIEVPVDHETEAVAQDLSFTVRGEDGPKTVSVHGALALPATLGPLEPLLTAVDLEVLGGWANE